MEGKSKLLFLNLCLLLILILSAVVLFEFKIDVFKNSLNFELIGDKEVILEYGEEYKEQGFKAVSNQKDVSRDVYVTSNVNEKKIGYYIVEYNLVLKYPNIEKSLFRKVIVQDTKAPILTIDGEKDIKLQVGDTYNIPKFYAYDTLDGDVTNKVKIENNLDLTKKGKYEIIFKVADSSNNVRVDKISVEVVEKEKDPHVEISISQQKLRYYEYGNLVLESDIVTGINNKTPTGTFKVINKARNIYLKGSDYLNFVSYWVNFKDNLYGLHDASWRSRFGGNIYKTNGSHGCVNIPKSKMKELFNFIEIGTPINIFM